MPDIDPTVAAILDAKRVDSDDEDALIAALEAEEHDAEFTSLRERRREQLHEEFVRAKALRGEGAGGYVEVKDEKSVLDVTTGAKLAVVHFFKDGFARCAVMDRHLEILAPLHLDTRLLRISVDNAPFLVTKLNIRVLPCVIAFIDGISVDRIIGFEGLGNGDRFTTRDLEARLLAAGVLLRAKVTEGHEGEGSRRGREERDDVGDDDEWD